MTPETRLKKQITDALAAIDVETIRIQCGRKRVTGGWMHFAKKGTPDLLVIARGVAVFFEVKTPGKKPTDVQLARHDELRRHGAVVWVVERAQQAVTLIQLTGARNVM